MACGPYYFVHLSSSGDPIPSTMFAKNNNKIDAGYKCMEARVTGLPMTPPVGYVQCRKGLRYWYQVDRLGKVLPNSFISVIGVPKGNAGRSCQYVEFSVYKPIV